MLDPNQTPTVYIVDDEQTILDLIPSLLADLNFQFKLYESGESLLKEDSFAAVGCVILDNHMPGMSGLELQAALSDNSIHLPCILMSGDSDFPDVVAAVRSGAIDFLEKPFAPNRLKQVVNDAVSKCREAVVANNEAATFRKKIASLTKREMDVYNMMVQGFSTKKSASELEVTPSTIEFHRTNILKKTGFGNISELLAYELRLKS